MAMKIYPLLSLLTLVGHEVKGGFVAVVGGVRNAGRFAPLAAVEVGEAGVAVVVAMDFGQVECRRNGERQCVDFSPTDYENLVDIGLVGFGQSIVQRRYADGTGHRIIGPPADDDVGPVGQGFTERVHRFAPHNDWVLTGFAFEKREVVGQVPR